MLALPAKSVARTGELRFGFPSVCVSTVNHSALPSLPMPSREEILNSPMVESHGATSGFTRSYGQRPHSPTIDEPGEDLDKELQSMSRR